MPKIRRRGHSAQSVGHKPQGIPHQVQVRDHQSVKVPVIEDPGHEALLPFGEVMVAGAEVLPAQLASIRRCVSQVLTVKGRMEEASHPSPPLIYKSQELTSDDLGAERGRRMKPLGLLSISSQPFRSEGVLPEEARPLLKQVLKRLAAVIQVVVQPTAGPTGFAFIRMA